MGRPGWAMAQLGQGVQWGKGGYLSPPPFYLFLDFVFISFLLVSFLLCFAFVSYCFYFFKYTLGI